MKLLCMHNNFIKNKNINQKRIKTCHLKKKLTGAKQVKYDFGIYKIRYFLFESFKDFCFEFSPLKIF